MDNRTRLKEDRDRKERLYQKLMLILQLVEDRLREASQHLEELIHRLQFDQI